MAARKTPSAGGKPDKVFRDALMLEVRRIATDDAGKKQQNINIIAAKAVKKAREGSEAAIQLIRDTLDGKPSQSIAVGQDPDLKPLEILVRPALSRDEWLKTHGG